MTSVVIKTLADFFRALAGSTWNTLVDPGGLGGTSATGRDVGAVLGRVGEITCNGISARSVGPAGEVVNAVVEEDPMLF